MFWFQYILRQIRWVRIIGRVIDEKDILHHCVLLTYKHHVYFILKEITWHEGGLRSSLGSVLHIIGNQFSRRRQRLFLVQCQCLNIRRLVASSSTFYLLCWLCWFFCVSHLFCHDGQTLTLLYLSASFCPQTSFYLY